MSFSGLNLLWMSLLLTCVNGGIFFPEELASLISIAYSNIPPTKIGTDSRVGFGFRIGPNADGQVLFELGPQRDTQPLGPDSSKRETKKESKAQSLNKKTDTSNDVQENSVSDAARNTNLEKLTTALTKWMKTVAAQRNALETTDSRTRVMTNSP